MLPYEPLLRLLKYWHTSEKLSEFSGWTVNTVNLYIRRLSSAGLLERRFLTGAPVRRGVKPQEYRLLRSNAWPAVLPRDADSRLRVLVVAHGRTDREIASLLGAPWVNVPAAVAGLGPLLHKTGDTYELNAGWHE